VQEVKQNVSIVKGPDTAPDRDLRFISLVDQYQEPLLRMCILYLRDKSLAEDAVQETFLKVYRTLDNFRGECSEKTWIMKIAMHTCYDMNHSGWFRFMNRRVTPDILPEPAPSPQTESDDELADAVTRLPRKLREVILLYYYQGLNVNEIAEALGISHSSVSCRMKRGREKLKELLEGSELDEPEDLTDRILGIHGPAPLRREG
jgi:RNA polymerase sigma-70 factor (ECF subfamily)